MSESALPSWAAVDRCRPENDKQRSGGGTISAPSLVHAIGNGQGGRVRVTPVTNAATYGFVSCEHPEEFIDAVRDFAHRDSWIKCDDGSILHLPYVIKLEVEPPVVVPKGVVFVDERGKPSSDALRPRLRLPFGWMPGGRS